jgi:serine/threonine protein phosphatase PrpC
MLELAKDGKSPEELCRALIGLALSRLSPDNVTAVVVQA